ncbi:MAG: hypothetical protein CL583_05255 [Alteromonadaceae bacterium]|nr:hypothetical protein [Alteromonadaceae bacterium]
MAYSLILWVRALAGVYLWRFPISHVALLDANLLDTKKGSFRAQADKSHAGPPPGRVVNQFV